MAAKKKGLHEELHALQSGIYDEADAIIDIDDGKFYHSAEDREAIRGHARRILELVDQYETLDNGGKT